MYVTKISYCTILVVIIVKTPSRRFSRSTNPDVECIGRHITDNCVGRDRTVVSRSIL